MTEENCVDYFLTLQSIRGQLAHPKQNESKKKKADPNNNNTLLNEPDNNDHHKTKQIKDIPNRLSTFTLAQLGMPFKGYVETSPLLDVDCGFEKNLFDMMQKIGQAHKLQHHSLSWAQVFSPNGKEIGRGSGTKIFKFPHKELGDIAVKAFEKKKQFSREFQISMKFNHPNILKVFGAGMDNLAVPDEFEWIGKVNESVFLEKKGMRAQWISSSPSKNVYGFMLMPLADHNLAQEVKQKIFNLHHLVDIAAGMKELHSHNPPLMHRDLTSKNVFVFDGPSPRAVVADFSVSHFEGEKVNIARGSLMHYPPEATGDKYEGYYSIKADVFMFATLCFEYLHSYDKIWPDKSVSSIITAIQHGERPSFNQDLKQKYPELALLISQCWAQNAKDRPDFVEIHARLLHMDETK